MSSEIETRLAKIDPVKSHEVLRELLLSTTSPSLGTQPKTELELALFSALIKVGCLSAKPSLFEIVSVLRVTRAKARSLLYQYELRNFSGADLETELTALLKAPLIAKSGEQFIFEIDNPLLADFVRSKLQAIGHASEASFAPGLVRMSLDAVADLYAQQLSAAEREKIRKALIRAGIESDNSLSAVLKSMFRKIGSKIADQTGAALMAHVSDLITALVDGAVAQVQDQLKAIVQDK